MPKTNNLEYKINQALPVLIGLWRFHNSKWTKSQWCCTWKYKDSYYDTFPKETPEKALDALLRNWRRIDAKEKG